MENEFDLGDAEGFEDIPGRPSSRRLIPTLTMAASRSVDPCESGSTRTVARSRSALSEDGSRRKAQSHAWRAVVHSLCLKYDRAMFK